MGIFDNFPYTNFHELNLDWILKMLQQIDKTMSEFVAINALKYADPIQWSIIRQYEKNTIVIDPLTGTAYISVQPVPSGVAITNTDYWTVVFDLGAFVVRASKNFAAKYEDATTLTATFPSSVNDWLIWGDVLYRAISPIVAGDQYVIGSNIEHFTAEDIIGHIEDLDTTDKSNLVAAINELVQAIIDEATRVNNITGDPDDLNTTDKSNLVAAINELVQALINEATRVDNITGDPNNLHTTDKSNLVAAINETTDRVDIIEPEVNDLIEYVENNVSDRCYCELIQRIGTRHYYLNADELTEPAIYGSFQGLCEVGNGHYLAMLIPIENLYNYQVGHITDLAVIVEYDDDFNEIRRSAPIKLYHGRNMCYHEGLIYINANTSGNTTVEKVVVVDYISLTVSNEISISDYGKGGVLYIKDGYLYTGSATTIVKRELDGTVVEVIDLSGKDIKVGFHSFKPFKNGYLATYNAPNAIAFIDADFNVIKTVNMPYDLQDNGEIKDFAIDGDIIYLNQNSRSSSLQSNGEYTEVYRNIFKIDLFKNSYNTSESRLPSSTPGKYDSCHVDGNTTSTKQIGTEDDPFSSVMMAIHYGYKFIRIDDDGSLYYFLAGAYDCVIYGNTVNNSKIYMDQLTGCTVSLHHIDINKKLRTPRFNLCMVNLNHCTGLNSDISSISSIINCLDDIKLVETEGEISAVTFPLSDPTVNDQKYTIHSGSLTIPCDLTALSNKGSFAINMRATYNGGTYTGNAIVLAAYPSFFIDLKRNNSGLIDTITLSITLAISAGSLIATINNATFNGTDLPIADVTVTRTVVTHII